MASKLYIQSDTYIKPKTNENTGYIAQAVNIEGINPDTGTTQSIQAILNHLYSLIGGSTPVVQYTVTFNTDGGSGSVTAITGNAGTQITLPTYSGTKSGYTNAQKWIINGTEYNQGATYTLNANVTAKAKWTQNAAQYTITFDTDGGSGTISSMTRDAGTQITLPTYRGTKTGYTNEQKWIIDGTEYNQGATYTLNDNVTATAKWTIKTYTVTLTVNGGSGSNSKTVDHGSTVTFTGVSPDSEHTDVGATITDVNASISGTTVTVSNVTSTKNITVTFPEIQQQATYYWYVGTEQPTETSNPSSNVTTSDTTANAWHEIGTKKSNKC